MSSSIQPNHANGLHPYAEEVLNRLKARLGHETEFLMAVTEVFESLTNVLARSPIYRSERILERLVEPDRVISFKVVWLDDRHEVQVHRGYRVQFNNVLGPYKGGTRFHSSVSESTLKSLAFEQTFKNSLTGLALGGGKGGSDFHPRGRSDREIMRFCQAYITELVRYIGPDTDVPAGDIGVGGREIGYMFGQYKRLTSNFNGVFTGKGIDWGGSLLRPEATGYGVTYFTEAMLGVEGDSLEGKTVAVSGFGNVAWGAVKKIAELGGRVVTLSGPDGFVYDADGIKDEKLEFMLKMRLGGRDEVREYADKFGVEFHAGKRPWGVKCDVAMPCAIHGELDINDARALVNNGCRAVVEGANMPCTPEAVEFLQSSGVLFTPGKASNAGGVAVSGLEMAQNGARHAWSAEEVDSALKRIMVNIHANCRAAAESYGHPGNYLAGANIAGFNKVAQAMLDQGVV